MLNARTTSFSLSICEAMSSGIFCRVALYVGKSLCRNVGSLRVEDDGDVIGLFVVEDLHQGGDEPVDRAGVHPFAVDQRTADEREIGAVGERHAVEEEEPFPGAHGNFFMGC